MAKMKMNVLDMMNEIAGKVQALDSAQTQEERAIAVEDAQLVAGLAKQFFVGANLAVEKERLSAKFKSLDKSMLDDVIGC